MTEEPEPEPYPKHYASQDLAERALAQLRANDLGTFVKPAERQYPHQWNWDAALVALGLATHDPQRARGEVRALLRGAWQDGMVPHILYHHGPSDYRPAPEFWRTEGRHPDRLPTSGLSQPPILASCLRRMHDGADEARRPAWLTFLDETFEAVLAWHRWWRSARDPDQRGLVALLHPWESGTDDAPRFAEPLARVVPHPVPDFRRADAVHVAAAERPSDDDYARFVTLIDDYRRSGWDAPRLWNLAPFRVLDPFVNAVLHRADGDLAAIASLLGRPTSEIDDWRDATQSAFGRLWSEERGTYCAWDDLGAAPLASSGIAGLSALWGRLAEPDRSERLRASLRDPAGFASPSDGARVPTARFDDPAFAPRRYWRGPVWIVTNWMIADGLDASGDAPMAATLRRDALRLVDLHGFWEHYDPFDGTPGGASGFSWSAALSLVLLQEADGATA